MAGPGLLIFGAIIAKLTYNFVQFGLVALKTFFNIGSAAKEIGAIQTSIANTLLTNKSIQTQILALEGNRVAQAEFFSVALRTQLATMEKIRGVAATVAPLVFAQTTGTGRATPRGAGGYMPSVMAESNDIRRGVGGARPSDRPVVIPNFAFGGGKVGTMVANTGEHIVKNYGGSGGSAIFNRDMAKQGLPINAEQIRSAGGFIPNFAYIPTPGFPTSDDPLISKYLREIDSKNDLRAGKTLESWTAGLRIPNPKLKVSEIEKQKLEQNIDARDGARTLAKSWIANKKEAKQSSTLFIDAEKVGGIGLASVSLEGPKKGITVSASPKGDAETQNLNLIAGKKGFLDRVEISNVQFGSLNKDVLAKDPQKGFRSKVIDSFTPAVHQLAADLGVSILPEKIEEITKKFKEKDGFLNIISIVKKLKLVKINKLSNLSRFLAHH